MIRNLIAVACASLVITACTAPGPLYEIGVDEDGCYWQYPPRQVPHQLMSEGVPVCRRDFEKGGRYYAP